MNAGALLHHLNAVSRVVGTRQIDGRTAHVVQASRGFAATREEVWAALTDPERIARWFLPITGDLRLGALPARGERRRRDSWLRAPSHPVGHVGFGGEVSWVDVQLSTEPAGTRLVLEHTALPSDHWQTYGPGATGVGWDLGLFGLERHLAGEDLDAAAFEAWSLTEPGKACTLRSALGRADAALAAGMDPDLVDAQRNKIAAFYTGESAV